MMQKAKSNLVTHNNNNNNNNKKGKGSCWGVGGAQGTVSFSDLIRSFKRSLLGLRIPVRERVWPRIGTVRWKRPRRMKEWHCVHVVPG